MSMDNTTSICYVNNLGGSGSYRCNEIAQEFWGFCREHNLWVTAAHLPGWFNVLADEKSRLFDDKTEWRLNLLIFAQITQRFGTPTIDLFASRLNFQLKPYVAWAADPESSFTDAFTLNWHLLDVTWHIGCHVVTTCMNIDITCIVFVPTLNVYLLWMYSTRIWRLILHACAESHISPISVVMEG